MNKIILLIFIIIFVVLYNIIKLYKNGTVIRCNKTLNNSILYKFNINLLGSETSDSLPNKKIIQKILNSMLTNGIRLDKSKNMNKANGLKLNFHQLKTHVPEIISFVENSQLIEFASIIVGKQLYMLKNDRYQIFARLYTSSNDFIDWHYDNNFSNGLRYTLIIPLYIDECNTSELMILDQKTCNKHTIQMSVGDAVLFDGSNVCHSITKQKEGCKRLTLIIPLYENPNIGYYGKLMTFIRDIGFDIFKL